MPCANYTFHVYILHDITGDLFSLTSAQIPLTFKWLSYINTLLSNGFQYKYLLKYTISSFILWFCWLDVFAAALSLTLFLYLDLGVNSFFLYQVFLLSKLWPIAITKQNVHFVIMFLLFMRFKKRGEKEQKCMVNGSEEELAMIEKSKCKIHCDSDGGWVQKWVK